MEIVVPNKIKNSSGEEYRLYVMYQPDFSSDEPKGEWKFDYIGDHGFACSFKDTSFLQIQVTINDYLKRSDYIY